MLEKLIDEMQQVGGLDRPTAEKMAYVVIGFLQRNLSPSEYDAVRRKALGSANWQNRPRSAYVGYVGYTQGSTGRDPNKPQE